METTQVEPLPISPSKLQNCDAGQSSAIAKQDMNDNDSLMTTDARAGDNTDDSNTLLEPNGRDELSTSGNVTGSENGSVEADRSEESAADNNESKVANADDPERNVNPGKDRDNPSSEETGNASKAAGADDNETDVKPEGDDTKNEPSEEPEKMEEDSAQINGATDSKKPLADANAAEEQMANGNDEQNANDNDDSPKNEQDGESSKEDAVDDGKSNKQQNDNSDFESNEKPSTSQVVTPGPKKGRKSTKKDAPPSEKKEETPAVTRSGRVSKKVENFEINIPSKEKSEPKKESFDGKGVALGTIACCQYWFNKKDSEDLKVLFKLCFNRIGKNAEVKRMLRQFNGYSFDRDSKEYKTRENLVERLYKQAVLDFLKWLGIPHQKSTEPMEDLKKKILDFLMLPVDHKTSPKTNKKSASAGRKSGEGSGKKSGGSASKKKEGDEVVSDVELSSDSSDDEGGAPKTSPSKSAGKSSAKKRKAEGDSQTDPATPKSKKQKKLDFSKATASTSKSPKSSKKSAAATKGKETSAPPAVPLAPGEPSDSELREVLKGIVQTVDLEKFTMKQVLTTVYEKYPGIDFAKRKAAIKEMVREVLV